jgi:hypothetical protein
VPELRVCLEYSLSGYYHASARGPSVQPPAPETRYSLAPESESGWPVEAEGGEPRPCRNLVAPRKQLGAVERTRGQK